MSVCSLLPSSCVASTRGHRCLVLRVGGGWISPSAGRRLWDGKASAELLASEVGGGFEAARDVHEPYGVRLHLTRGRAVRLHLGGGGVAQHASRALECVGALRSEEHTSELQSLRHLVCRL